MTTLRFCVALCGASAAVAASAQTLPGPVLPPKDSAVILSPFEVNADNDRGYQAANTLGATRTNVAIRDLPMQINVVTEQLMVDRALFDLDQVLDVIPGTARTFNEFVPQANIRGFDSSAAMRNGVRGLTTPDMNSIARVETLKGPAALLYGQTQPGGVINYITKNPSPQKKTTLRLSAGTDGLFRSELDNTGPLNAAKTFNYRLGATYYTVDKGERQRSLERVSIAFNAFQGNRVLATSTQPDGSMARGMIREGASWTVSSTLSFEPRTPDGARFRARLGARLKLTRSDHPATRRPANRSRFKSPGRSSDPPSSRTLCRYSRGVRPS